MTTRRDVVQAGQAGSLAALLASLGLPPTAAAADWSPAAFAAKTMAEVAKALGATATPTADASVVLTGPDVAENGAVVPVSFGSSATGVKRLLLLIQNNPNLLAAVFDVTGAIEPSFSTRVKMAQSSKVYALALMADGRALYAQREIKVILGGCG